MDALTVPARARRGVRRFGCSVALLVCSASTAAGPGLCLVPTAPANPTTGEACYPRYSTVEIDVTMSESEQPVCGAQLFLEFDATALEFINVIKGSDIPGNPNGAVFNRVLASAVNVSAGTIDYAVADAETAQCFNATSGPATIARLRFRAIGLCSTFGACFRAHNPPTRLSNVNGEITPVACDDPAGGVAEVCTTGLSITPVQPGPICAVGCPCATDGECSDGLECTGNERCVNTQCRPGTSPCAGTAEPFCDETTGACRQCLIDADTDDGLVCTWDRCIEGSAFNTDIADPPPAGAPDHFSCLDASDPDQFCVALGGSACAADGACVCAEPPALCLNPTVALNPINGQACYTVGSAVAIDVVMTYSESAVCGAQFFLEYDPLSLDFVAIVPGSEVPDNPNGAVFNRVLALIVDEGNGTIDYAVADNETSQCASATNGPAIIARLLFRARGFCRLVRVCTRPHNPGTLLAAADGQEIVPISCGGAVGVVTGSCSTLLNVVPTSPEVFCSARCPCLQDSDCDDGRFCTGAERCIDSVCQPGANPCDEAALPFCDDTGEACVECLVDADAADGVACTLDRCVDGVSVNTDIRNPPPPPAPEHFDCRLESDPNQFCIEIGGSRCEADGSCVCIEPPALCLDVTSPVVAGGGSVTVTQGAAIQVDVNMAFSKQSVCGAQFFLEYDPSVLELIEIIAGAAVPDNPNGAVFSSVLASLVDEEAGTIDYAVADAKTGSCANATHGPATIARLRFRAQGACIANRVCFRSHNPPTRLANVEGEIGAVACEDHERDIVGSCSVQLFVVPPEGCPVPAVTGGGVAVMGLLLVAGMSIRFGGRAKRSTRVSGIAPCDHDHGR